MAELDQTSTPQFKRCSKCGEYKPLIKFQKREDGHSRDGYRGQCSHCQYIARIPYKQSARGKESAKQYRQSERGKASSRRGQYNYKWSSPEKVMKQFAVRASLERKEYDHLYYLRHKDEQTEYQKQHCHELQDKYGKHTDVREWYPAARLIEALETAPIVEIKGE